jgi:serine phosphatase RsbU (regulator of sigma subunit)
MTFVTAALAILDAETGEGRLCVAGHEAPLRLSNSGVTIMGGFKIQPPLGIIEDLPYASAPFALAPGEAMLLLSDGVTEAHDMAGDLFGKDRVLAALGTQADPAAAIAALLRDVAGFVREAPPADDVTVLAVRYAG